MTAKVIDLYLLAKHPADLAGGNECETRDNAHIEESLTRFCFNNKKTILTTVQLREFQAAIIASGHPYAQYKFAQDIESADIKALQAAVIASQNGSVIYMFARDIGGADIVALRAAVDTSGDKVAQFEFYDDPTLNDCGV